MTLFTYRHITAGFNPSPHSDFDNAGSYPKEELKDKTARVTTLLPQVFAWAREADPMQPLTSGVWAVDTSPDGVNLGELQLIQLRESDIVTFHNYTQPEFFKRQVAWLKKYDRPVICTEFMARPAGSTFDTILPIAKHERVGAINWGFVAGKTQTQLPRESWEHPYVLSQPPVWFHEVLRPDGTPYRQAEVDLIRELTGKKQETRDAFPRPSCCADSMMRALSRPEVRQATQYKRVWTQPPGGRRYA